MAEQCQRQHARVGSFETIRNDLTKMVDGHAQTKKKVTNVMIFALSAMTYVLSTISSNTGMPFVHIAS